MNLKTSLLLANKYTPNPQYFTCASPEVPILPRDSLHFLQDIGEGCFGKVYKGTKIHYREASARIIAHLEDILSKKPKANSLARIRLFLRFL